MKKTQKHSDADCVLRDDNGAPEMKIPSFRQRKQGEKRYGNPFGAEIIPPEHRIIELFKTLSPENKERAAAILRIFAESAK